MNPILRFELRYQASQRVFPLAALAFFFFGFVLTATGFGPERVALLSPFLVAQSLGFLSLLAVFPAAIFTSQAVLRDDEHQMADLIFATPIRKRDYLGNRFVGAFLATFLVLSLAPCGMLTASFLPSLPAERLGPVDPLGFVLALLLMALPAVAFSCAFLFSLAIFTRSTLATAVGSVLLYFLYWVAAALTNSPLLAGSKASDGSSLALAGWLDPFGLSSFFSHTLFWTVAEQNSQLPYGGLVLPQRLGAFLLAGLVLIATYRQFRFQVPGRSRARWGGLATLKKAEPDVPVRRSPDSPWLSKVWLGARWLAGSWALWLVIGLWLALALTEILSDLQGEYGSLRLATTGALIQSVAQPFQLFGLVVLVYFGTELLWLDASSRLEPVLAATPFRSTAWALAQWSLLAGLVLVLGFGTVLLCLAVQVIFGYPHFEPVAWLGFLFGATTPLFIFAAIAVFLHRLAKNRHLGLFASLLLALVVLAGNNLGLEHPLLRLAQTPPLLWSGLSAFGGQLAAAAPLFLYWGLLAALLLVIAAAIWRRGERPDWRTCRPLLAALASAFVLTGGTLYSQIDKAGYESSEAGLDWEEAYERKYRDIASINQPRPVELKAAVALFPQERRATLAGQLRLENQSQAAIDTLWVNVPRDSHVRSLTIPQGRPAELDPRFQVYRFALAEPLPPGATIALDFDLEIGEAGLPVGGPSPALVENGSYLTTWRYLPVFGYFDRYEIDNPGERARRGLPAREANPENPSGHGGDEGKTDWVRFDLEISTDADQTAIGPGRLVRSWQAGERAHFHYDSGDKKVPLVIAIASARFEKLEREVPGGRHVELYWSGAEGQRTNAERILEVAALSLETFEQTFRHPYLFDTLRLVELPSAWRFGGFATPGTVFLVERRSFEIDTRDAFRPDLLGRRVAHEVAHQWWGHSLSPMDAPGGAVLVESLAKYSELLVLEKLHGREAVRRLLEFELERYFEERSGSSRAEVPLTEVDGQSYLFYRKGTIAMGAIAAAMGPQSFAEALATLLEKKAGPDQNAKVDDLINELNARADAATREKIDEWLHQRRIYDFTLLDLAAEPKGKGWLVTLEVEARHWSTDGDGNEEELPLEENVGLAILTPEGEEIQHVRLVSGKQQIQLETKEAPLEITIDPEVRFLDKTRWNNQKGLD